MNVTKKAKPSVSGVLTLALLCLTLVLASAGKGQEIEKVFVSPSGKKSGNIVVVYKGGKKETITKNGKATDPKISPDKMTIVCLEMVPYKKVDYPSKIVGFRGGMKLWSIDVGRIVEDWKFRENGKQIAVSAAGLHGPTFFTLYDVASGKLVSKCNGYDGTLPQWTAGLENRSK